MIAHILFILSSLLILHMPLSENYGIVEVKVNLTPTSMASHIFILCLALLVSHISIIILLQYLMLLHFQAWPSAECVELTFELPDNAKECFHEIIEEGTESTLEFQV